MVVTRPRVGTGLPLPAPAFWIVPPRPDWISIFLPSAESVKNTPDPIDFSPLSRSDMSKSLMPAFAPMRE